MQARMQVLMQNSCSNSRFWLLFVRALHFVRKDLQFFVIGFRCPDDHCPEQNAAPFPSVLILYGYPSKRRI